MKVVATGSVLCAALAAPAFASAAIFDFQGWTDVYGEQGFTNSSPFCTTVDSLTLTATASESGSGADSNVYMDEAWHEIIGGMGVCTSLDSRAQCNPSSDDNVSDGEILTWDFDQNITGVALKMGNDQHFTFATTDFRYRYSATDWMTATTNALGMVTLDLDGTASRIEFMTSDPGLSGNFYIRNADISAVPVPAAIWLFGSGLLGLAGRARLAAG